MDFGNVPQRAASTRWDLKFFLANLLMLIGLRLMVQAGAGTAFLILGEDDHQALGPWICLPHG
jgi:hypothetical protein